MKKIITIIAVMVLLVTSNVFAADVRITRTNLDCHEGITGGYDSCTLTIKYSIHLLEPVDANAFVTAKVDYSSKSLRENSFSNSYSTSNDSGYERKTDTCYIFNGYGDSTIRMEIYPNSILSKVVSVRVDNIRLGIDHIF